MNIVFLRKNDVIKLKQIFKNEKLYYYEIYSYNVEFLIFHTNSLKCDCNKYILIN